MRQRIADYIPFIGFCYGFLGLAVLQPAHGQDRVYELTVQEQPLIDVFQQLNQQYELYFSYKVADIEAIRITRQISTSELSTFLTELLANTGLGYETVSKNYLIVAPNSLSTPPPSNSPVLPPPLQGEVVDATTGEPLAYAGIYLQATQRGTYADGQGRFQLQIQAEPSDTLVIHFVGYQPAHFAIADFRQRGRTPISLRQKALADMSVTITDYLTDGIMLGEHGAATLIRPERVGAVPGQVEPDVMQTIRFLPGVATPDARLGDLYIRGGKPDQNLVTWEDIPIYQTGHFFGMISAFNPYIMEQVDVYRGGFGAEDGGRIAGLVKMESAGEKLDQPAFGIGTNATHAFTYGKMGLGQDRATLVYSGRHSLTSFWESPTFTAMKQHIQQEIVLDQLNVFDLPETVSITDQTQFWDAHAKLTIRLTEKDVFTGAAFMGEDRFGQKVFESLPGRTHLDTFVSRNQGIKLGWSRTWNTRQATKVSYIDSRFAYNYQYALLDEPRLSGQSNDWKVATENELIERHLKLSHQIKATNRWIYELGYQLHRDQVSDTIGQTARLDTFVQEGTQSEADIHIFYVQAQSPEDKKVGLKIGVRYNSFVPSVIPRPRIGLQRQILEPRLQLWYRPSPSLEFNAHLGNYAQFLSQLITFQGEQVGIETPVWVLAGQRDLFDGPTVPVNVIRSQQYQLGGRYYKKGLVLEVQAYLKYVSGLTSLAFGFDDLIEARPKITDGDARMRGIDMLAKKRWKAYRTWLSYSLSEVLYDFGQVFGENSFYADYDQRHVLRWANQVSLRSVDLSLGLGLASGRPFTAIDEVGIQKGPNGARHRILYKREAYNNARFGLQHRVDISVLYRFLSKPGRNWKGKIGFSAVNVYNQVNLLSRDYYLYVPRSSGGIQAPELRYQDQADLLFTPQFVLLFTW